MKKLSFIFIMTLLGLTAFSQEECKSEFDLSADIVSRYVWRGIDFGNSPAIQPGVTFSSGGLAVGAWGSYDFNGNFQESDFFVSYTFQELLSLTVTDYYFPGANGHNYFEYGSDSTAHVFEGTLAYNGVESLPISFLVSYDFYGADKSNSLYFELGYSTSLKGVEINPFLGASFATIDMDDQMPIPTYYMTKNSFGVINIGASFSKEVKITEKYSLPISSSLIFNPDSESFFITFGITL